MSYIASAVSKAMARLVIKQPWFAALALRLKIVEEPRVGTAAVDGITIYYNPAWFDALPTWHQESVIAHEVMHCACLHMTRRGHRDPKMWNAAGDHVINLELIEAGFKLPEPCLHDERFKGLATEQVYGILEKEQSEGKGKPFPQDMLGEVTDCPKGQGGGEDGEGQSPAPSPSELETEWNVAVEQANSVCKKAGTLPGSAARLAQASRVKTDWRAVLQRYLTMPGDYSWSRPSRRFIGQGIYLPGSAIEKLSSIVIAVDTSGSVDARLLGKFGGEAAAILDAAGWPDTVWIVYCDTHIQKEDELHGEIRFTPMGGGGTLAQPVFDWVKAKGLEPAVCFYLTDLELGDRPKDPGNYPVVWVVPESATQPAPFGERIAISMND